MRLFTALDPPDALRESLTPLQSADALPVRWTAREQFHVTLRFIGAVEASQARRFDAALRSLEGPAPRCVPYGLDALPSRRTPRVLAVGLKRTDSIVAFYNAVSSALEAEGLPPEDRDYRPHITLGRLDAPPPDAVHAYLRHHQDLSLPSFQGERVVLYESTLMPNGAQHERRAAYPLAAGSG